VEFPHQNAMMLLFGLADGQRIRVIDGAAWLSARDEPKGWEVLAHRFDEVLARGWIAFASDDWDAPPVITQAGEYWLVRWFWKYGGKPFKDKPLSWIVARFQLHLPAGRAA
jgi:hypothetical protein